MTHVYPLGIKVGYHEAMVMHMPHLKPAYQLAKRLFGTCEASEELYFLLRALYTWVERKGCRQDVEPVMTWLQYCLGRDAKCPLVPRKECTVEDIDLVHQEIARFFAVIRGRALAA